MFTSWRSLPGVNTGVSRFRNPKPEVPKRSVQTGWMGHAMEAELMESDTLRQNTIMSHVQTVIG